MELFPMNAQPLKGKKRDQVLQDPNYVAEIKWNGYRQVCLGGHLLSRSVGVDGQQKSKTEWVPHITHDLLQLGDYWFDGELLRYPGGTSHDVTRILQSKQEVALEKQEEQGYLTYVLFDLMHTPEGDITSWPWHHRRVALEHVYKQYLEGHPYIKLSPVYQHNQIADAIEYSKNAGLEGVMLKNVNGLWIPSTATKDSRPANNWYKIKHEIDHAEDVFIIGFVKPEMYYRGEGGKQDKERFTRFFVNNWIGGVRIGQYRNGIVVEVGSFSGITDDLRADMSLHPERYLNRVCMVKGFERNETGRFTSPVFLGFRDDKRPEECVWI